MSWKIFVSLLFWISLVVITKLAWPYKKVGPHFQEVIKKAHPYDIEVNVVLNGFSQLTDKLLYKKYEQNKGTLSVNARIKTPANIYTSNYLKQKHFTPEMSLKDCKRNSPSQLAQYCSSGALQAFEKQYTGDDKSFDIWSVSHVIAQKTPATNFSDISYSYKFELCKTEMQCQLFQESGQLVHSQVSTWYSPIFGHFNDHALVIPFLVLIIILLVISLFGLVKSIKSKKQAKQWLSAVSLSLVLSPLCAALLAWLFTLGTTEFEGTRGFGMLYLFVFLTPILFVIFLLAFKIFYAEKKTQK